MRINPVAAGWWLVVTVCLAPLEALAQTEIGAAELARAKTLLELSRAKLTVEELTLLSGKLAEAQTAYVELTTVVQTSEAAVAVTEGSAAATGTEAAATGSRALLGGVTEVLPLLLLFYPATAHAPGVKQETPKVHAARLKVGEKLKELADAARKIETEKQRLRDFERRCPLCSEQLPYPRTDSDHTHHPCTGEHVHYFVWEQNPKTCQCFIKDRLACL